MISEILKADSGMMTRFQGYKPNTTLTSLNLSYDEEEIVNDKENKRSEPNEPKDGQPTE